MLEALNLASSVHSRCLCSTAKKNYFKLIVEGQGLCNPIGRAAPTATIEANQMIYRNTNPWDKFVEACGSWEELLPSRIVNVFNGTEEH